MGGREEGRVGGREMERGKGERQSNWVHFTTTVREAAQALSHHDS